MKSAVSKYRSSNVPSLDIEKVSKHFDQKGIYKRMDVIL